MSTGSASGSVGRWRRVAGLLGGPGLALLCWILLPTGYRGESGELIALTPAARVTIAVMAWMAVWWLTEAIDIAATALLPIVVLPLLGGVADVKTAAAPYAHPLIFLFLGGFLLALSMQRWGLDRRIALATLRCVGTRPANMVGGVMLATAVLSMFVSNTATAAMMLPIALSVVALLESGSGEEGSAPAAPRDGHFAVCMMLGIAYAASIGGMATKIGTPPNGLLMAFVEEQYHQPIDFVSWLRVGIPMLVILLPVAWLLLTRILHPLPRDAIEGADGLVRNAYRQLGRVNPGERATLVVFLLTATAWIARPLLERVVPGISDTGIVMTAALVLFILPADRRGTRVLEWATARNVPWGILILFGGGLSIAAAVRSNGVAEFIGHQAGFLAGGKGASTILAVLVITTLMVFLTELTSNTATTAAMLPVLAAIAPGLGVHPYMLLFPAALAASCAFMMPVATPPNAIVFGSGRLTIAQMAGAGLWLNFVSIALITMATFLIVEPFFVAGQP